MATFESIKASAAAAGKEIDDVTIAFTMGYVAGQKAAESKSSPAMPVITLSTGAPMPAVGLGTWKSAPGEVGPAIEAAFSSGYRHFDCALCYGNEVEVGAAFTKVFKSGAVKREEVFITSKLWNHQHHPDDVRAGCEETLKDLQLDYLDLYLIHWPQGFARGKGKFPKDADGNMLYNEALELIDTWKAMEALVDAGLVKAIGLSNFNSLQIAEVAKGARIPPAVLQVESHPFFQQGKLIEVCKKHNMAVTTYSPLGSGQPNKAGQTVPLHPKLAEIGAKYSKSAAQVAIRYNVQRGLIVIPKSIKPARIAQNIDVIDFSLSAEDMATIASMDENTRVGWGGPLVEREGKQRPRDEIHRHYPFKMGDDAFF